MLHEALPMAVRNGKLHCELHGEARGQVMGGGGSPDTDSNLGSAWNWLTVETG